jgi:hypothetical protein
MRVRKRTHPEHAFRGTSPTPAIAMGRSHRCNGSASEDFSGHPRSRAIHSRLSGLGKVLAKSERTRGSLDLLPVPTPKNMTNEWLRSREGLEIATFGDQTSGRTQVSQPAGRLIHTFSKLHRDTPTISQHGVGQIKISRYSRLSVLEI